MKITLLHPHRSIITLATDDLPDFAVLIGRNGAGKTQILEAIKGGLATVPGINQNEIEFHNIASFVPPSDNEADRSTNWLERETVSAYLSPADRTPPVENAKTIFEKFASDIKRQAGAQSLKAFKREIMEEIRNLPDFAVLGESSQTNPYITAVYGEVLNPIKPREANQRRAERRVAIDFNGNPAAVVSAAMKLSEKLPHELSRQDILHATYVDKNLISNSISAAFTAYKFDQFSWAHKQVETRHVEFTELVREYRAKNKPPWELLREIMSTMRNASGDHGLFDFDFSDPESHTLDMNNFENYSFLSVMTNRTSNTQYFLDSLSSGEKVLMTLCLILFNTYLGRPLPKLLLLDEIDALLHPSLLAALTNTLESLFVSQGTKVLMTSHSPMTVAALNESSIFRVVRNGSHVKVSRATKLEAIDELSEGLATVDMGLRIAAHDKARITILTEGNNTKHIKRWAELFFPEEVHVLEGLEQHSNDTNLLLYARFLAKVNTNTHFVVVWDCDASHMVHKLSNELPPNANVTPFAFPKRLDNELARKGVENNYNEEILEPFSTTTTTIGGSVLSRSFHNARKTDFANHVLHHGEKHYFSNYKGLCDIVSSILEPQEKS